uniref:YLP motif-containing protein 1 n=1 Tax=Chenopodium quinoa TaxID=63459 RepID=A0A803L927_CHEQI
MDHSWRPHPTIQGNICPTCSISHFPFCPPLPHPSTYSAPNLDPNFRPINMNRPVYNNTNPSDPYYDPGFSNRNPGFPHVGNFGNVNGGPYSMQNPGFGDGSYMGNDYYNNVNDRGSKRLRVDGNYPGIYGVHGDGNYPASKIPVDGGERRLKMVHDHGGPNPGFGFGGDMRGNALESSGFDRNVDVRVPGNSSEFGVRPLSNVEMSNNPAGVGHGVHYQRDGVEYGSRYSVKRSVSEVEHGYHHSNYGMPRGSNEGFYGSNVEPIHSHNAPIHYDQRSNLPTANHYSGGHPPLPPAVPRPGQLRYDYGPPRPLSDLSPPIETRPPPPDGYHVPAGNHIAPARPHYGAPHMDYQGGYGNSISENTGHFNASQGFDMQPPLPASPPPPLPMEPPGPWPTDHKPLSSPPRASSSLFPVPVGSSAPVHTSHAPIPESHTRANSHPLNSQLGHMSRGAFQRDAQGTLTSFGQYLGDGQTIPSQNTFPDKPKTIDATHLFKPPHRKSRPDHFVIILRGLPGSGKSYLAKMLRDLEVEHGGSAPRIHSMDDYFMTEVEKVEENDASKSSGRFKKPTMKMVLEYCYEPEMEEAYRSSMLKAFKKTLEEGAFTFMQFSLAIDPFVADLLCLVLVDDRNLRVADFAQFWATAKRSGYEVYVLEAPYKDPAGCTARNIHGFNQVDVEKMAAKWEEAPSMYLQVDAKSLFHGDDLKESNIEEVDMDTEDGDVDERVAEKIVTSSSGDFGSYVSQKDERNWNSQVDHPAEEVKDLGRSKWSDNLDDDDDEINKVLKGKATVLSGLVRTYGREGKSVHWGDQGGNTGFSIGAVKKANLVSLVIGPGAGYNLKSNPLPKEEATAGNSRETKKHTMFQERQRAEQESFRAVFDRRRHRIGGLDPEED